MEKKNQNQKQTRETEAEAGRKGAGSHGVLFPSQTLQSNIGGHQQSQGIHRREQQFLIIPIILFFWMFSLLT